MDLMLGLALGSALAVELVALWETALGSPSDWALGSAWLSIRFT